MGHGRERTSTELEKFAFVRVHPYPNQKMNVIEIKIGHERERTSSESEKSALIRVHPRPKQ